MTDKDTQDLPETGEGAASAAEEETGLEEEESFAFVEAPSFEVEYKGACAYEVGVSVPPANLTKLTEELYGELKGAADVPGFRRGKAPRKLLERKFSKTVRAEALQKLVAASFERLLKEQELHPIGLPDIDGVEEAVEAPAEAPVNFTLKFEVAARCELGKYRGLELERPVVTVDDKDVDEVIENLRERFSVYETAASAAASDGDQVIIDFHGTIDGEEFSGNKADNYPYILGSGRFFEEFEQALKGRKAGESVEADVTFPEGYAPDLAGKTAHFVIKVNDVKRKTLPAVDDAFASEAGYEDLAGMRAQIAESLRERSAAQSNEFAEREALKQIIASSTFELPKSVLEGAAKEYHAQEVRRLMALRTPPAEIDARDEELRREAEENAEREIKSYVALSEIAEAEGAEVTEEDLEQEAEAIQERTGAELQVIQRFLQDRDRRSNYTDRILRRKALAAVMESATFIDKELPREEEEASDA